MVETLLHSKLVAWDIETKWDMTALLCSGFCGDDYQPYVALWGYEFDHFAKQILEQTQVPLVGHNGPGFDTLAMRRFFNLHVGNYGHDTQQMWWALEPDLAGTGDTDEDDAALRPTRMTRKGLAFLASIYFNLPWWKNYPPPEDPEHVAKMVVLNGRDAFVTRWLADCMLPELAQCKALAQYEAAVALYPALTEMNLKGLKIDETLRLSRVEELTKRYTGAQDRSSRAGLKFIEQKELPFFAVKKKCDCCGGGTSQRAHCIKCGTMLPDGDWLHKKKLTRKDANALGFKTVKEALEKLLPCTTCKGTGKITEYHFNPYSPVQMKTFLYEAVEAPKQVWNQKVTTDSTALKKILRWARGQ